MEFFVPSPNHMDRCALCDLPILPSNEYVLTWDEGGVALWWHMGCRDRMIPFLLAGRDEPNGWDEEKT